MKNLIVYILIFLASFSIMLFVLHDHETVLEAEKSLLKKQIVQEAKNQFNNVVVMRKWNADHGGVYIKQHDNLQPNPYLIDNAFESHGEKYIKINPAWMTRQLSLINNQMNSVHYKITSLQPLNPSNKANKFEKEALTYLQKHRGEKYYYRFEKEKNDRVNFRFLGVLITQKSCLSCHAIQGYKEGDIRGGISVVVPTNYYTAMLQNIDKNRVLFFFFSFVIAFIVAWVVSLLYRSGLKKAQLNQTLLKEIEASKTKTDIMIMQSRQIAMEETINMIAHQWRQPLGNLSMSLNGIIIDIELDELDTEALKRELDEMMQELESLSQTIEYFKVSFKSKHEKETFRVASALEKSLLLLEKSFENEHIKLIKDFDCSCEVNTYLQEFSQIILQILQNAREILNKTEKEEKWIKVSLKETNQGILISIEDNGGGIADELLEKIFDPYFSTKESQNGVGLGLYMAMVIITQHLKGTIEVTNTSEGARFDVLIPKK